MAAVLGQEALLQLLATYPFCDGVLRLVEEDTKPVGHDCINGSRGERLYLRVYARKNELIHENGVA